MSAKKATVPPLTESQRGRLLAACQRGLGLLTACVVAGVDADVVRATLKRDAEFLRQWRAAKAAGELTLVNMLHERAKTDYRAAAWLLKRLNPKRYEDL